MDYLLIGRFTKPFGLKGEMKAQFYVDEPRELDAFSRFYIKDKRVVGGYRALKLERIRYTDSATIVTIENHYDINLVEPYKGFEIFVDMAELPPPTKDDFYIKDLLDCAVVYDGRDFGVVKNVIDIASRYMLVVKMTENEKDLVVPFHNDYIQSVDIEKKTIVAIQLSDLM